MKLRVQENPVVWICFWSNYPVFQMAGGALSRSKARGRQ